jgi:hypothetical protein
MSPVEIRPGQEIDIRIKTKNADLSKNPIELVNRECQTEIVTPEETQEEGLLYWITPRYTLCLPDVPGEIEVELGDNFTITQEHREDEEPESGRVTITLEDRRHRISGGHFSGERKITSLKIEERLRTVDLSKPTSLETEPPFETEYVGVATVLWRPESENEPA